MSRLRRTRLCFPALIVEHEPRRSQALPEERGRSHSNGGEMMADVTVLQEGEEPKDARNFVLVEQIPAPRGSPRYRVVAQGVNDDGACGRPEDRGQPRTRP